jgi:hypothetical protein
MDGYRPVSCSCHTVVKKCLVFCLSVSSVKTKRNVQKHSVTCIVWVRNLVSLTLREKYRLGVSENRVLRRICGPRRGKVMGG